MNPGTIAAVIFTVISLLVAGCRTGVPVVDTSPTPETQVPEREFVILHTTDFHGRYAPFRVEPGNATAQTGAAPGADEGFLRTGHVGGFAWLAGAIERFRNRYGEENVLLVHGGDTFSDDLLGNLTEGELMIRLMNDARYHFMALGNHDFDYGAERTKRLQELAVFPMRAANIVDEATGEPFLGRPWVVRRAGGVRVGLLALGYPNTPETTAPRNVKGLRFIETHEAARQAVRELEGKSDVIVAVSHLGSGADRKLAREVEGIDIMVGGHSHDRTLRPVNVNDVWIVQAMSDTAALGELRVRVRDGRVSDVYGAVYTLYNDTVEPSPTAQALIDHFRAPHADYLDEVIARADERIGRQYRAASPFDRLAASLLRERTDSEVAFLPGVGYGISLARGPITREALYRLLPHPTRVVTLRLRGSDIRRVLEQSAWNIAPGDGSEPLGGLVQTDGLSYALDLKASRGNRVSGVRVNGKPLEADHEYRVATHEGMLRGLHRYTAFRDGTDVRRWDMALTELVEEGLRSAGRVRSPRLDDIGIRNAHAIAAAIDPEGLPVYPPSGRESTTGLSRFHDTATAAEAVASRAAFPFTPR